VRLLLDTHAILWWLADDDRLGSEARALIGELENDVFVSVVSLWEIVVKQRVGKLKADIEDMAAALLGEGFVVLDIGTRHLVTLSSLPVHHRDPFDHLLIAQAMAEEAVFVSQDQNTQYYPVTVITCSNQA
jgi:PIN domain nuclease of toxin-antitoxin system